MHTERPGSSISQVEQITSPIWKATAVMCCRDQWCELVEHSFVMNLFLLQPCNTTTGAETGQSWARRGGTGDAEAAGGGEVEVDLW